MGQILNHARHWDMKEVTRRFDGLLDIFRNQTKLLEATAHLQEFCHRGMIKQSKPILVENIV
jgi:hypothetical protein